MLKNSFSAVYRVYALLRLFGVAVHEISHAGAVLLSGGRITEFDIMSHVSHKGRYTLGQQLMISYAPMVVNTGLAAGLAYGAIRLPSTAIPTTLSAQTGGILPPLAVTLGLQTLALVVAFIMGIAALPSVEDAMSPYQRAAHNIKHPTFIRIIALPFELIVLVVFLVPLAFASVRSRSFTLSIGSEIGFALLVLMQATGTVDVITPTIEYASTVV